MEIHLFQNPDFFLKYTKTHNFDYEKVAKLLNRKHNTTLTGEDIVSYVNIVADILPTTYSKYHPNKLNSKPSI